MKATFSTGCYDQITSRTSNLTIGGIGKPYATVTLFDDDGTVLATASTNEGSSWIADINLTHGDGTYRIRALQKNSLGYFSLPSEPFIIVVKPDNQPPRANLDAHVISEDAVASTPVITGNVLDNDTDPDKGDSKKVTSILGGSVGQTITGLYGTVGINVDGSYVYTFNNKAADLLQSLPQGKNVYDVFAYTMADGSNTPSNSYLTIIIVGANDAPTVKDTIPAQVAVEGQPFSYSIPSTLFSDVDGDGLVYRATLASGAALPTWLTFNNPVNRLLSGTPPVGAPDLTIRFTADDGHGGKAVADWLLTTPEGSATINQAPVATDVTVHATEDTAQTGWLTATDRDSTVLTYALVASPKKGAVTVTDAATGAFIYTPNANVSGSDSFSYRANDGKVNSNMATVTITIAPVNDAPEAYAGVLNVSEDSPGTGVLRATDPDETVLATMTYAIVTQPDKGSVTLTGAAGSTFVYTPYRNQYGSDSFTFKASDGKLDSNVARIALNIAPANDAPTRSATLPKQTASVGKSFSYTIPTTTFSDPDGDTLSYSVTLAGGTALPVWLSFDPATRVLSGTPPANALDTTLQVTVNDGHGGVSQAELSLVIEAALPAAPTSLSTPNNNTNSTALTISGSGVEKGATVTLYDGSTSIATATAGTDGSWNMSVTGMSATTHNLTVRQTVAGYVSAASSVLSVTVDTTAAAPKGLYLEAVSDTGRFNGDQITSATNFTIYGGGAEDGAKVTLYDSTTIVGTGWPVHGYWSASVVGMSEGTHHLTAKQTDLAGNTSTASSLLSVTVDTSVAAPVNLDLATVDDTGSSNTDNVTSKTAFLISGSGAESGATVTLYDGTTGIGTATAGTDGLWNIAVTGMSAATHSLAAQQTDIAGNTSALSNTLSVVVDTSSVPITSIQRIPGVGWYYYTISANGRYVVFESDASNLVS
ncbi:MAG: tandem-95 repeat protein, partial [Magnetococcales bacterium]|nr:tandem-95 repeat protein [Magnetococcales bacterium]